MEKDRLGNKHSIGDLESYLSPAEDGEFPKSFLSRDITLHMWGSKFSHLRPRIADRL